jgi:hypothetical protein
VIAPASRPAAGAFLTRLLRLDPAAVVRLRPVTGSGVVIWARLPFAVLVNRPLVADVDRDVTVRARELFEAVRDGGGLPPARDSHWRWPLPSTAGDEVEAVPAAEVRRVAAAAASTARTAMDEGVAGRAVGSRRIRDALLDHVPIVIDTGTSRVQVTQRLVQGIVKMDFVGNDDAGVVVVRRSGAWIGLAATHGSAWYRPIGESLNLHVSPYRSNG